MDFKLGTDPISAGIGLIDTVIGKIWPDKTEEQRASWEMAKTELVQNFQLLFEQIRVNAVEAASVDKYTSRWRPTVGYICCAALAWNFLFHPWLVWALAIWGKPGFTPPPLTPADMLYGLLFGMLGIGGMRSWEKGKGVA